MKTFLESTLKTKFLSEAKEIFNFIFPQGKVAVMWHHDYVVSVEGVSKF
jgi:hypothetical protein